MSTRWASLTVPPIVATTHPLEWTGDREAHTNRVLPSVRKGWTCKACGDRAGCAGRALHHLTMSEFRAKKTRKKSARYTHSVTGFARSRRLKVPRPCRQACPALVAACGSPQPSFCLAGETGRRSAPSRGQCTSGTPHRAKRRASNETRRRRGPAPAGLQVLGAGDLHERWVARAAARVCQAIAVQCADWFVTTLALTDPHHRAGAACTFRHGDASEAASGGDRRDRRVCKNWAQGACRYGICEREL